MSSRSQEEVNRYLVLTARRAWALARARQGWPCADKSSVVARGASSPAFSVVAVRGDVSLIRSAVDSLF